MESAWNLSFSALGGLAAFRDGAPLDLGGPKQRLVLALLLLAEGEAVPPERLVDRVWGEAPPDRAEASLQAYVSNLRKVLEPDRAPRQAAAVLVTRPAGYAVAVDRDQLDLTRFIDLTTAGIDHQRAGRPAEAEPALAAATAMWKPLLPEFADVRTVEESARRLATLAGEARANLYAARLDLGESSSVLADLRDALDEAPLDERLWGHLALALYRAGRQADALRSLAEARRVLGEEVGVEPGPALRALESDILDQSPSLIWVPVAPSVPATPGAARPAPGPTAAVDPTDRPLFVGRDRELDALTAAVGRAREGDGTAVVVSGEPGIGKTRLVEELADSVRRQDVAVAWARCPESAATSSFFAVSEVAAQLEAQGIVDLEGRLGFDAVTDDTDRIGIYRRTTDVLRDATGPALVVLDDLQWADPGTLRMVEFIAGELRRLPIALVVTTRPPVADSPEPLVDCLSELARSEGSVRLDLDGLDVDAVAVWLDRRTSGAVSPHVAGLVHDRSGGNPFFAQELVELMVGEDRLDPEAAGRVPAAVADVVRRRVGRLPAGSQKLLSVASVIGRTFDLDVVAHVSGSTLAEVLDALDAPVAAGLVAQDPGAPARFRFSHALVAEALETELAPSRRARLHVSTMVAIEELRAASLDRHLAELAHHALAGAIAGSATDAVRWSVRAGERAEQRHAPEDAAGHYQRALEVVDLAHPAEPQVRLDLLRSLGRAWAAAGSEERAQRVLADAVELADDLGDVDAMVASALALVHPTLWQPGEYRGSNERLVSVVDLVLDRLGPDGDVGVRALLGGFRANLSYYVTPRAELDARSAAAVALARRTGDDDLIARVLVQRLQAIWFAPNAHEQLAISDEALSLIRRSGLDAQLEAVAELQRVCALYQLGTYDEAAFEHVSALVRAQGSPIQVLEVDAFAAARLACEGRYVEAQAAAAGAEDLFRRTARRSDAAVLFGSKLLSFVDQGMLDEIVEMTAGVVDSNFATSSVEMMAFVMLEFGMPEQAREAIGPVGSLPEVPDDWMWLSVTCNAAMVRAALGDVEACAVLHERLAPYSGQVWIVGSVPVCGCVDLALGRLAATLGRHDDALRHIEVAIEVDGSMGARAWLARSLEAKAELTGDPADHAAALALATAIGCVPVLRRLQG
ncbi:ATP-binding protein [Dermatobacter hominis]|uniref:ATP-binding protein n=1 Tax=Dermatobacter hominis TaxID=2884263 RepID=UPI001D11FC9F|nr:BTAD domain-containing putative transcriptional regulator [Dermatobacter hominis]UDY35657.1 AAA family ATPase [Dermatobacter hominis]